MEHLDRYPSHFRLFFPIIGSLKKTRHGRTDGPTNQRTDGRTDGPSYRYAWTHLKIVFNSEDCLRSLEHLDYFPSHFRPFSPIIGSLKKMRDGRTDARTDGLFYRDAWTHLKTSICFEINIFQPPLSMRCPFTKRCHPIDNAKTALTHCIDNAISAQSPKLPMHWQRPRFEILPLTLRCLRSHLDVTAFVSKLASHFQCKGSAKQTRVKHETLASLALSMQKLRVLHWTRVSSLKGTLRKYTQKSF